MIRKSKRQLFEMISQAVRNRQKKEQQSVNQQTKTIAKTDFHNKIDWIDSIDLVHLWEQIYQAEHCGNVQHASAIDNQQVQQLRLSLLEEEFLEYKNAVKTKNKIEILDGLLDVLFVCLNSLQLFIPQQILVVFNEVILSNFSKLSTIATNYDRFVDKIKKISSNKKKTQPTKMQKGKKYFGPKLQQCLDVFKHEQ